MRTEHDNAMGGRAKDTWVIIDSAGSLFGIPALAVQSMVIMPQVAAIPQAPDHIRGVTTLRGRVLPLVDLRVRFGKVSLARHVEELCGLLAQRRADHENWLAELQRSVTERRPFTLTTDPHACAFGKWYDAFQTDDLVLSGLLKGFDRPHKAIHAVAQRVEETVGKGEFDKADALIEKTRGTVLQELVGLFESTAAHLKGSNREIAIIVQHTERTFALAVDSVEGVEWLSPTDISAMPDVMSAEAMTLVHGVVKRKKDASMVLLLHTDALFGDFEFPPTA
jgi:purine-binding chemotaxis protein CheW